MTTQEPGGLHVLVVEDSVGDEWLMAEILRSRGHMVTTSEEAREAFIDTTPHPG